MATVKKSNIPLNEESFFYTDVSTNGSNLYVTGYDTTTGIKDHYVFNSIPGLKLYNECAKETEFKSLVGNKNLVDIPFQNIQEYNEYKKSYEGFDDFNIYGDSALDKTWISNTYGKDIDVKYKYINIGYFDIECETDDDVPNPNVAPNRITSIALYCTKSDKYYVLADKEFDKKYFHEDSEWEDIKDRVVFFEYTPDIHGEYEMLKNFCYLINELEKVDVLSAYNGTYFDFPYVYNRLLFLSEEKKKYPDIRHDAFSEKNFSPIGLTYKSQKTNKIYIKGIQFVDYFKLYLKYRMEPRSSYKLDSIAEVELSDRKIQYVGSLTDFYNNNYSKYVYYNFHDTRLMKRLDKKLKFMDLIISIGYIAHQNISDTMSPVQTWENILSNHITPQKIINNPKKEHIKRKYLGAYTHDCKPAFYKYCQSFDLNSLYPHLIMQYYISPETLIDEKDIVKMFENNPTIIELLEIKRELEFMSKSIPYDRAGVGKAYDNFHDRLIRQEFDLEFLKEHNITMSPSIEFFRKDENAVLPYFMDYFYNMRKKVKKIQLKAEDDIQALKMQGIKETDPRIVKLQDLAQKCFLEQMAYKILLNSAYGAFGNIFFRFFDLRLAKSITSGGRYAIRSLIYYMENELREVYTQFSGKVYNGKDFFVYSDTDSIYIQTEPLIPIAMSLYKKVIKKVMGDRGIELDDNFFANIVDKFETKSDPLMEKYFKPHDVAYNGLMNELLGVYIPNEYKSTFESLSKDFVFKRKSKKDKTIYFYIGNNVEEKHEEFKNLGITVGEWDIFKTAVLDDFANTIIQDIIDANYKNIAQYLNAKNKMVMKRECICINGVWVSKKNYILNVLMNEDVRYAKPKTKITGLLKTTTPPKARESVKSLFEEILSYHDPYAKESIETMDNRISEFEKIFKELPIEEIAINKKVTDIDKWCDGIDIHNDDILKDIFSYDDEKEEMINGTPMHVIGTMTYNNYIEKNNLTSYQKIKEGDKIKYLYLKQPNYLDSHVICFKEDGVPPELEHLVDKNMMWEKAYLDLVNILATAVKLPLSHTLKNEDIMDFFN